MQSVPSDIDFAEVEKRLLGVTGVINIHEFHIWQLSDTKIIGTVHASCNKNSDFYKIATEMKAILHKYGVHATTIQPEFVDSPEEVN
jgi:zinc transporter 1